MHDTAHRVISVDSFGAALDQFLVHCTEKVGLALPLIVVAVGSDALGVSVLRVDVNGASEALVRQDLRLPITLAAVGLDGRGSSVRVEQGPDRSMRMMH
jgi:hypothetical protein